MAIENVETLLKSQNFMEPASKKRKTMEEKQKLEKKKESLNEPKRWLNTYSRVPKNKRGWNNREGWTL